MKAILINPHTETIEEVDVEDDNQAIVGWLQSPDEVGFVWIRDAMQCDFDESLDGHVVALDPTAFNRCSKLYKLGVAVGANSALIMGARHVEDAERPELHDATMTVDEVAELVQWVS